MNPRSLPQSHQTAMAHRSVRTLGEINTSTVSASPDQAYFPMPLCRTIDNDYDEKNLDKRGEDASYMAPKHLFEEMRCLRDNRPEGHYRIYSWIFGWLDQLLRSTEAKGEDPHRKSLLAMCLRKIPACVDNIVAWDREASQDQAAHSIPGTSNVSREIYGQLERFGYTTGLGWRPLKHAVRAHGVSTLENAVSDGLFEPAYVGLLVRLCAYNGCIDEAASLAFAISGALPPPRNAQSSLSEGTKIQPLRALLAATVHAEGQGHGAAFGIVSNLIKEKRLPASWLPTKAFSTVLTSAVEAITEGTCGSTAIEFLATTMDMLLLDEKGKCWEPQVSDRQQTVVKIAASLATAAMDVRDSDAPDTLSRRNSHRRLLYALDHGINKTRPELGTRGQGQVLVLSLARCLAGTEVKSEILGDWIRGDQGEEEHRLYGATSNLRNHYRLVLHLVCSIAQGRSQETPCPGHNSLIQICHKLGSIGLPGWFLQALTREGTFLLAQKTKDSRDVAFAERQMQPVESVTPGRVRGASVPSRWRWEEGIGEWVMQSPETKKQAPTSENCTRTSASKGMAPGRTQLQTICSPDQTDRRQVEEADGGGADPSECDRGSRGSGSEPMGWKILPSIPQAGSSDVTSTGIIMPATLIGGAGERQETRAYARRAAMVEAPTHGKRLVPNKGSKEPVKNSNKRFSLQALRAVQGKGKAEPAAAPNIGRRRQLVIVRGPGGRRAHDRDAHWLQW